MSKIEKILGDIISGMLITLYVCASVYSLFCFFFRDIEDMYISYGPAGNYYMSE